MVDFWQFITNVTAATSLLSNGTAPASPITAYKLPDLPYAYDVCNPPESPVHSAPHFLQPT